MLEKSRQSAAGSPLALSTHQHALTPCSSALREMVMTKYKLEYIWLDGYTPVPNLRGKTQLKDFDAFPTLEQLPLWGFDGSSTMQAVGHASACILKPVSLL